MLRDFPRLLIYPPNMLPSIAKTPDPPYFAVIFTSLQSLDNRGYAQMAERMTELAATQPGFLGVESAHGDGGFGITVSYWASEEAIANWKANLQHQGAQTSGKRVWYADYHLRVARVERACTKAQSLAGDSANDDGNPNR